MLSLCLVLVAVLSVVCVGNAVNDWPIIGLFSQPSTSSSPACGGNCTYIAASYVKYLEAAGARVVPIDFYATHSELDHLFESLNGFFFPGGSAGFPEAAQYVFDKTVKANAAGDFSPLWGTCMGFQWLLIAASRDQNVLDPKSGQMDAYNYSIPLEFTSSAAKSRLFTYATAEEMEILAKEDVTMNNHHYGIWTDHFKTTSSLSSFFNPLSVNKDRNGDEFISTIEAFDYPIYGSQWHPEKNPFEWGKTNGIPNEAINHSRNAVKIAQFTANFFVDEARKSKHRFASSTEEQAALIENYAATPTTGSFMSTYFFHF